MKRWGNYTNWQKNVNRISGFVIRLCRGFIEVQLVYVKMKFLVRNADSLQSARVQFKNRSWMLNIIIRLIKEMLARGSRNFINVFALIFVSSSRLSRLEKFFKYLSFNLILVESSNFCVHSQSRAICVPWTFRAFIFISPISIGERKCCKRN